MTEETLDKEIVEETNEDEELDEEVVTEINEAEEEALAEVTTEEVVEESELESKEEIDTESLTRKEKKRRKKEAKLRKKFFFEKDIKYRGPLSYRCLRVMAWASIAIGFALSINNLTGFLLEEPLIGNGLMMFLSLLSALSVPFFIIATFSTILNRSKPLRGVVIFYMLAYFGFALAIIFVYYRYINSVLTHFGFEAESIKNLSIGLGNKLEINVFADLFALALFYFFMVYNPKKLFVGKKIIIFRIFSLIPLLVALLSYFIKLFANLGYYNIPFALNPFLTTKPPFIYVLFIVLVLWLKKREKIYIKLGGTKKEYLEFEKTNRNSLSFSIFISIVCLVISVIDILMYSSVYVLGDTIGEYYATVFQLGGCSGLFLAIPFLLLFSYSRRHKQSSYDIIIVLSGIGMIAFAAVEMIYETIMHII